MFVCLEVYAADTDFNFDTFQYHTEYQCCQILQRGVDYTIVYDQALDVQITVPASTRYIQLATIAIKGCHYYSTVLMEISLRRKLVDSTLESVLAWATEHNQQQNGTLQTQLHMHRMVQDHYRSQNTLQNQLVHEYDWCMDDIYFWKVM